MIWNDDSEYVPEPFLRGRNPYSETADPEVDPEHRGLLKFPNYEAYLDSLVFEEDVARLESYTAARMIASLGCRSTGETLSKETLLKVQERMREKIHPKWQPFELASSIYFRTKLRNRNSTKSRWRLFVEERTTLDGSTPTASTHSIATVIKPHAVPPSYDRLMYELALREKANRMGVLATIIYVNDFNKHGHELSGYIDYGESLLKDKWVPYFQGKKRLTPNLDDLAFYHWKYGKATWKSSRNYRVILDPKYGLIFQHRYDRKTMLVDPRQDSPGCNTIRVVVSDSGYHQAVLFDHFVRKKL